MNLKNYLDQIVPKDEEFRWIYKKDKIETVPTSESYNKDKKIEKVLSIINKNLENYGKICEKDDKQSLNQLKMSIEKHVKHYHEKHHGFWGKIYLFFSRVIYGDVDKLCQQVFNKIGQFEPKIQKEEEENVEDKKPVQDVELENLDGPTRIVETFKREQDNLVKGKLSFKTIESLKAAKKEAKQILQNPHISVEHAEAMKKVIKQYDEMVESIEVLSILRQISKEIRKPIMAKGFNGLEAVRPTADRFYDLVIPKGVKDRGAKILRLNELASVYGLNKEEWKQRWSSIRESLWKASQEAQPFLNQKKEITFITGSKSASIPSILKVAELAPILTAKPALIPTGQLLKHHIAPLAGELAMGISPQGVNQNYLSGMKFEGLKTCMGYASAKEAKFDADQEIELINEMKEIKYYYDLPRLHVAVLRLLLMGAKREEYENIKGKIQDFIKKEKDMLPIKDNWQQFAPLIGIESKEEGKIPQENELKRGQIVAVPRTGSRYPKYGVVLEKNPDGTFQVLVEKSGVTKSVPTDKMTLVPDERLALLNEKPITLNEKNEIEKAVGGVEAGLKAILKLFDIVKPINFSESDLNLIQDSFPLVWASVSLIPEPFRQGIKGEQIVPRATLGEDIQLVFTPQKNMQRLQSALNGYGVQVMSFDAAYYIMGRNEKV